MKWVALALLVIGIALAGFSFHKLGSASYEEGGFLIVILGIIAGIVLALAGLDLWLGLLFFKGA